MPLQNENLGHFTGTEGYTRWSPLFPRMVLTDGAKFVAENGGGHGAYWLMDAIASHQPTCMKHEMLREMQFWTLKVNPDKSCVLECRKDSGHKPTVRQEIEYTDFDLAEIKLYVAPLDEKHYVIMLPSEY